MFPSKGRDSDDPKAPLIQDAVAEISSTPVTPGYLSSIDSMQSATAFKFREHLSPTSTARHSWNDSVSQRDSHYRLSLNHPRPASESADKQHISWNRDNTLNSMDVLTKTFIEITHAEDSVGARREVEQRIADIAKTLVVSRYLGVFAFLGLVALVIVDNQMDSQIEARYYYLAGSVLTIISAIYVFVTYHKLGPLNRHPASLHIWITFCDLLLAAPLMAEAFDYESITNRNSDHLDCYIFSFLTQIALMGSATWFVMLSWDLYRTLKRPFVSHGKQLKSYHIFAWTISLMSGAALLSVDEGPGVSNVCVCWIRSKDISKANIEMWLFYYIFVCLYFLFSISVLIYCVKEWKFWHRSQQHVSEYMRLQDEATTATIQMKRTIIKHNAFHVITYLVYFMVLFIVYFSYDLLRDVVEEGRDNEDTDDNTVQCSPSKQSMMPLLKLFAVLVSGKGVLDAFVWYYKSNLGNLKYELLLRSEIPQQYRKDVMRCTLIGIRDTALMASGPNIDDIYHQRYFQCLLEMNVEGTGTQYSFIFRSYAMLVFRHIREANGITTESYLQSLCGTAHGSEVSITGEDLKEIFSEGKSGSFLYFSRDKRFIIKTMSHAEAHVLLRILNSYHTYMDKNPDTLISRLYGLHSIIISGSLLYFVVMENVIHIPVERAKVFTFDLKGSWEDREVDRPTSQEHRSQSALSTCFPGWGASKNTRLPNILAGAHDRQLNSTEPKNHANKTLKDIDFEKIMGSISVGLEMKSRLLAQLRSDTEFLCGLGIMDYSLLLSVSEGLKTARDRRNLRRHSSSSLYSLASGSQTPHIPFFRQYCGGIEEKRDDDRQSIVSEAYIDRSFHIGIIDLFQEYNFEKKAERWAKVHLRCKDGQGISSVSPEEYAQRFTDMIDRIMN